MNIFPKDYSGILLFGANVCEPHHFVAPAAHAALQTAVLPEGLIVVADAYAFARAHPHFKRSPPIKLVLLAASPLVGDVADLLALVNLLRRNDGFPEMTLPNDAFWGVVRCYARFSPTFFRIYPNLFEPALRFAHPTHRLDDSLHLVHRVGLGVYPIRCSHHQIQEYRRAGTEKEKLLALTMSYPKHANCVVYAHDQFSYTGSEKCFANLAKYSPKLQTVVANATKGAGRVLIYARFLNSAIPAALALEEAGFRRPNRPMLAGTTGGNGLRYVFISRDELISPNNAAELELPDVKVVVLVEGASSHFFQNIRQVHVLDAAPHLGKLEELLARCTCAGPPHLQNAQMFLYASIIDLDEEALDMYLYRRAETDAAPFAPLLCRDEPAVKQVLANGLTVRTECKTGARFDVRAFLKQLYKEKLVYTRDELLKRVPRPRSEVVAALLELVKTRDYVVDRFGTCGPVGRFDDYYVFEPIVAPDPAEEAYLQARGLLKAATRTWGRMAAGVLQGVSEEQQDRVVVAHVVESARPAERDRLFERVRRRETKFDELVLAYIARESAAVAPDAQLFAETVGTFGARGLVLLKGQFPRNLQGDREMVACELELRLRLLDDRGPRRWFLSPAEAALVQKNKPEGNVC
jgi:hypothetical protein